MMRQEINLHNLTYCCLQPLMSSDTSPSTFCPCNLLPTPPLLRPQLDPSLNNASPSHPLHTPSTRSPRSFHLQSRPNPPSSMPPSPQRNPAILIRLLLEPTVHNPPSQRLHPIHRHRIRPPPSPTPPSRRYLVRHPNPTQLLHQCAC